jgi:hypothetical protein
MDIGMAREGLRAFSVFAGHCVQAVVAAHELSTLC